VGAFFNAFDVQSNGKIYNSLYRNLSTWKHNKFDSTVTKPTECGYMHFAILFFSNYFLCAMQCNLCPPPPPPPPHTCPIFIVVLYIRCVCVWVCVCVCECVCVCVSVCVCVCVYCTAGCFYYAVCDYFQWHLPCLWKGLARI